MKVENLSNEDLARALIARCGGLHAAMRSLIQEAARRLMPMENLFQEPFNLGELQEMVHAANSGNLVVVPLKPGDEVYWIFDNGKEMLVSAAEVVVDAGVKGFYINGGHGENVPYYKPCFYEWSNLNTMAFKTIEEATRALALLRDGEVRFCSGCVQFHSCRDATILKLANFCPDYEKRNEFFFVNDGTPGMIAPNLSTDDRQALLLGEWTKEDKSE